MLSRVLPVVSWIERTLMHRFPAAWVVRAHAFVHGRIGEPELAYLPNLVKPGTTVVDVGGHFGVYSVALARLVGPDGQVVTVEPIVEDAQMIASAARRLKLPIRVVNVAASRANGEATLHVPAIGSSLKTALSTLEASAHSGDLEAGADRVVPMSTLDEILAAIDGQVSFIKIDVEGHERAVLEGASTTLATYRPNLLVEINDEPGVTTAHEVIAWIESLGYRGQFLEDGTTLRSASVFNPEQHQRMHRDNPLSRQFINNFIFRPIEPGDRN